MPDATSALFSPYVGSAFVVDRGPDRVALTLGAVEEHRHQPGAPREDPFALVFLGVAGQALSQGTYCLRHPDLGSLDVFLVPIGPAADGRPRYEAVFN